MRGDCVIRDVLGADPHHIRGVAVVAMLELVRLCGEFLHTRENSEPDAAERAEDRRPETGEPAYHALMEVVRTLSAASAMELVRVCSMYPAVLEKLEAHVAEGGEDALRRARDPAYRTLLEVVQAELGEPPANVIDEQVKG